MIRELIRQESQQEKRELYKSDQNKGDNKITECKINKLNIKHPHLIFWFLMKFILIHKLVIKNLL